MKPSIEALNTDRIPVLPSGAAVLLQQLTDDNIDYQRLAETIEKYPTIAARLIALSNSVWSSPAQEITSLEMACARLGLNVVRSTGIALALSSPFNPALCPAFDSQLFWSRALLTADCAFWVTQASSSTGITPATARAAGLLHNLGILWLAGQLPKEVEDAIQITEAEGSPNLNEAMKTSFGFGYSEAGEALADAWKLPQALKLAMSYIHYQSNNPDDQRILSLIKLSASMVSAIQNTSPWSIPENHLEQIDADATRITKIYSQLVSQQERIQDLAAKLFP